MIDAFQYEFMRHAMMAGLLAGVICGIMGTLVVVNRIVFLSGGIAHAAYGGIGLSFYMGWPLLAGTMGFSVAAAMTMAVVTQKARHRADTIIGVIWAVGMALGIVLLDLTPGYHVDLMSYLFGSILAVPVSDIWMMLVCQAAVVFIVGYFYQDLLAMAYDEEFAQVRGVPVRFLYMLMIIMLAVSVVMIIQVVGLILVIALLTIGPFIVEKYTGSLATMMLISSLLNVVFVVGGLWLSYAFNLTSGAAIILVAASGFFMDQLCYRLKGARVAQPNAG
jgi:zinc transport system permease protein